MLMARFPQDIRDRVASQIPPQRCNATSKRSGVKCQMWAMVGSSICHIHGAKSPQAKRAAAQRIALAEAQADFDLVEPREPWEVLRDALHVADMLLRRAKVANNGGVFSPTDLDTLTHCIMRAANLAKMNLDAGYDERRVKLKEHQAAQIQAFVTRILTGLELSPAQQALVPMLIQREVGALMPKVIEGKTA